MTADTHMLEGVLREPFVLGAAIFRADRSVLHLGLDITLGALADVATTARHLFRETHPKMLALDVEYEKGRTILIPLGDSVLLVSATVEARVQTLMDSIQANGAASEALPEPPAREPRRASVDAVNAVLGEVKKRIGGPVIRNYLKRAQREVRGVHSAVDALTISLAGTLASSDESTDPAAFVAALGALTREFLVQVATVEAAFLTFDLRAATRDFGAELEGLGFYGIDPAPRPAVMSLGPRDPEKNKVRT